ncbi:Uncharacterized protein FWK35_00009364 [Aphis craccivora]|uniref:Uncharacterized protein n=1 Tax=Aphis craccivora TaxID=307492 RepID=A0A6G0YGM7_APHCR|nr:Uncharacterized protein FWK35_00009364 [Aphis craccivora]
MSTIYLRRIPSVYNVYTIYSKTLDQLKYKMLIIEPEKALPNSLYILVDIVTEGKESVLCRSVFPKVGNITSLRAIELDRGR